MNRNFTLRENLLLRFFVATLLFGAYYYVILKPLYLDIDREEQKRIAVEDELEIQRYMSGKKEAMLAQLDSGLEYGNGELGVYNNLSNEIKELDKILAGTQSYNLSFSQAEVTDNIVRRNIFISYETRTYNQACDILEAIENSRYQCLIKDVRLSVENGGTSEFVGAESVRGNVMVTFYETVLGAENTSGLAEEFDFTDEDGWEDDWETEHEN